MQGGNSEQAYPRFPGINYPRFSRDPCKHWAKNIFRRREHLVGADRVETDRLPAEPALDGDSAIDLAENVIKERCLGALTVSRCLERLGDIATNIAEDVIYLETAEIVRHEPPNSRAARGSSAC